MTDSMYRMRLNMLTACLRHRLLLFACTVMPVVASAASIIVSDVRQHERVPCGQDSNVTFSASFEIRLELPDTVLTPAVSKGVSALVTDGRRSNADIAEAVWEGRRQFFAACKADAVDAAKESEQVDEEELQWTRHINGKPTFQNRDYLGYSVAVEDYNGCPCGSGAAPVVSNATFECASGRRLMAADLVEKTNERKLLNLIRSNLAKLHTNSWEFAAFARPEIRTDEELAEAVACAGKGDVGAPFVSDNFCFTTNGIMWTFNACDIVCGAWGAVDVVVPWKDVRPLLKKDFVRHADENRKSHFEQ